MNSMMMTHPAPLLSVPLTSRTCETLTAMRLLDLATQLEGMIGDRLKDLPGIGHAYVSSGGTPTLVALDTDRFTQEFLDGLFEIKTLAKALGRSEGGNPFLSGIAERIDRSIMTLRLASPRTCVAYVLRRNSDRNALWYSPLAYASTDGERGLAYFFGIRFLPVLRNQTPPKLREKIADVGFGVVAALSLFAERSVLEDLNEANGYVDPKKQGAVILRTDDGWRIEP